jgi:hypothetical protein
MPPGATHANMIKRFADPQMPTEPITISQKQARALLIANQGLAEPFETPEEAVKILFAVQTQYAASLGVALAARVQRMKPSWPENAFNRNPVLLKTWSLRSTVHAHHLSDRAMLKGFNEPRYAQFIRWMEMYQSRDVKTSDNEELMLAALASGPLTRPQLHAAVPQLKELGWTGWGADVKGLALKGDVIIAPAGPGHTQFVLADQWLGPVLGESWTHEEAVAEMFRRYLRSHAPASVSDFMNWMIVKITPLRKVLADVVQEFVPVKIEKMKELHYVLADQVVALEKMKRASGVRLLAKFDPLMMAHKDKQLYLSPKHHKTVFQMAGQVEATVLIDGLVSGIWRISTKSNSGVVAIQPFRDFTAREVARIDKEVARLGRAIGIRNLSVDHSAIHVMPVKPKV